VSFFPSRWDIDFVIKSSYQLNRSSLFSERYRSFILLHNQKNQPEHSDRLYCLVMAFYYSVPIFRLNLLLSRTIIEAKGEHKNYK
jgi:hypothetical protein